MSQDAIFSYLPKRRREEKRDEFKSIKSAQYFQDAY
jgi:hypothetical protein